MAESDSLGLSISAVLRAISLEAPASEILSETLTPLPFWQSEIAIDDRVSVTLTPSSLDFGSVPVGQSSEESQAVNASEPSTLQLLIGTIALILLFNSRRRSRVALNL
jgi:hypothetical protein